jgi:hypothetical protein
LKTAVVVCRSTDALTAAAAGAAGGVLCVVCLRGRKVMADNDADADYDRAARELAFEAKGQVGGRHRHNNCLLAAAATAAVRWADRQVGALCPAPYRTPCAV